MVLEEPSFQPTLNRSPAETLDSQSLSLLNNQESDTPMSEDEDPPRGLERVDMDYIATILEVDSIFRRLPDLDFIETVIEDKQSEDRLWSIHQQAGDHQDTVEERYDPSPTPAEISPREIEERACRIARFHGSVVNRYLERIMDRAKTRSRFAPLPKGRNIWYCVGRASL